MMRPILVALLLSFVLFTASAHPTRTTPVPTVLRRSAAAGAYFDYVLVIIMENHNLCDVLTSCGGAATYLSGFASSYGLATQDLYCSVHPSLPNYLCLSGASDFGCQGYDGNPQSNSCTNQAWQATNIVDRLETNGLTWKAYMEDMPSNCYATNSGDYAVRHNPFVYYGNIRNDTTRCARVVPAGPSAGSDATLLADLGSTSTASNYMWLTPNIQNDMHSSSIPKGDAYMSTLVPQILDSTVFKTTKAALYVTFDEGTSTNPSPIYTVWAGPVAKTAYSSSFGYNHFSFLATVEANWKLTNLTANDRDAPNMTEFFVGQPSRGVSVPPPTPFPLGIVLGIAIPIAAVAIVAFLLLRRRKGKTSSPPEPRAPGEQPASDDEWEL